MNRVCALWTVWKYGGRDGGRLEEKEGGGKRCLVSGDRKEKRRCETFAGEFGLGFALVLACWHQQDMRQHTLSSSFIIHTMNMRYEVTGELSHCFKT